MQTILSQKKILNIQISSRYHLILRLYFKTFNYRFYPQSYRFFFSIPNTKFLMCVAVVIYFLERLVHISLSHYCRGFFSKSRDVKEFQTPSRYTFFKSGKSKLTLEQQKICIDITSFFKINLIFHLKYK